MKKNKNKARYKYSEVTQQKPNTRRQLLRNKFILNKMECEQVISVRCQGMTRFGKHVNLTNITGPQESNIEIISVIGNDGMCLGMHTRK